MLQLRTVVDGEPRRFPLVGDEVRIGRGSDNEIVLSDFSVSRHHAVLKREADGWVIYDLMSTNGVQANGAMVRKAALHPGDQLGIGVFEVEVEPDDRHAALGNQSGIFNVHLPEQRVDVLPEPVEPERAERIKEISNATVVRPVSEILEDYGFGPSGVAALGAPIPGDKREALAQAYDNKVFGYLTRLAGTLISADSVDAVLVLVMDIAFEALPVERGFILLTDEDGDTSCRLARSGESTEFAPREVPISNTIVQTVMAERVALLSYDALSDQRLTGGESIRIHQIRAAMCVPLWSGERIIGMMQVDSPFHVGTLNEQDLEFLTALANYAAVAVERIRYAHSAERERQMRSRLERYHSPAVIQEVLARGGSEAEARRLEAAQVTVLFADVVGFTALAESLPPKELAKLLEIYFTHCAEAIFAQGGTLDKFIGDCVMAFFGAPVEQEDHALRGVRAALQIQEALRSWNEEHGRGKGPSMEARIALNSGPVMVGDIGSNRRVDYTVLGNTVNVAARLEQFVAEPGQVVIGAETHRLLEGNLPANHLGEFQLKGLSQKIRAYRVLLG